MVAQDNKSDSEPFTPGPVAKAMMVTKLPVIKKMHGTWYLNLCTSRHLCNDKKLFKNLWPMCIDFVIAAGQIIQTKQIGTISILLKTGQIDL